MARRVLSAGYPLAVWNRSPGPADLLAAEGAARAQSPVEAVRDADVVILMLADAAAVHAVIEQAAPALRAGTVVVDASTIGPEAVAAIRTRLPDGVAYLDAPVMGSVDRATSGQLGVLVGGDAEPVLPLLRLFGTVTSTGPVGTAAALKIVLITAVVTGVAAVAVGGITDRRCRRSRVRHRRAFPRAVGRQGRRHRLGVARPSGLPRRPRGPDGIRRRRGAGPRPDRVARTGSDPHQHAVTAVRRTGAASTPAG